MIPKKIHYCWFGGNPKPEKAQKCIASWKEYCPDFEIIEWNEDNFDIHMNPYTKYCIENKKYAFLSDYVRLVIIEKYGGIYFDTDVELIKPLEKLLDDNAFLGFETDEYVATGLGFGAEPHHPVVDAMLKEYDYLLDGQHGTEGCPRLNTKALIPMGLKQNGQLQTVNGVKIYPKEYFNPYDDPTGRLMKTSNTVSIHWYSKSWMSKRTIIKSKVTQKLHRIFGVNCFQWLKKIK